MKEKLLYAYVSIRTRITMLPQTLRTLPGDERGAFSDYISTGMLIAGAIVVGGGILALVPGLIHNYVNNLLTNCLQGATSGTTPTGCP